MLTGNEMQHALNGDQSKTPNDLTLTVMARPTDKEGAIAIRMGARDPWIDFDVDRIQSGIIVGRASADTDSVSIVKITIKPPSDARSQALYELLRSAMNSRRASRLSERSACCAGCDDQTSARALTGTTGRQPPTLPTLPPVRVPPPRSCGDCELLWLACMAVATEAGEITACMNQGLDCFDQCF